jgi:hypothetical protein
MTQIIHMQKHQVIKAYGGVELCLHTFSTQKRDVIPSVSVRNSLIGPACGLSVVTNRKIPKLPGIERYPDLETDMGHLGASDRRVNTIKSTYSVSSHSDDWS